MNRYKKYYIENREKRLLYAREYYKRKPEITKNWSKDNKEKTLEIKRRSDRKRRLNPINRVNAAVRSSMWRCLKGKKEKSWQDIVGYTIKDLTLHLEKLFTKEMSWDNYGTYWHIDHIVPLSNFSAEQIKESWSLSNLRPLEAKYNIRKSNLLEISHNNFIRFKSFAF